MPARNASLDGQRKKTAVSDRARRAPAAFVSWRCLAIECSRPEAGAGEGPPRRAAGVVVRRRRPSPRWGGRRVNVGFVSRASVITRGRPRVRNE